MGLHCLNRLTYKRTIQFITHNENRLKEIIREAAILVWVEEKGSFLSSSFFLQFEKFERGEEIFNSYIFCTEAILQAKCQNLFLLSSLSLQWIRQIRVFATLRINALKTKSREHRQLFSCAVSRKCHICEDEDDLFSIVSAIFPGTVLSKQVTALRKKSVLPGSSTHKDILEGNSLGNKDLWFSLHSQFSLLSLWLFHTLEKKRRQKMVNHLLPAKLFS